jgi:hypothetical protein
MNEHRHLTEPVLHQEVRQLVRTRYQIHRDERARQGREREQELDSVAVPGQRMSIELERGVAIHDRNLGCAPVRNNPRC